MDSPLAAAFTMFGPSHLVVIALTVLVPAGLIVAARRFDSPAVTRAICWTLAAVLLANEVVYYAENLRARPLLGFVQESLPLHICGIALYMTVVALITRRQIIFEMACFWGLVGTPQAILTPSQGFAFPEYWFWQFFICHCGIVVGVVFAIGGLGLRPRPRSAWRVFIITNGWLAVIAVFDWLVGANYWYLVEAPKADSPLLFLPWPWYILLADGLMLVGFLLVEWLLRRGTQPVHRA